MKERDVVPFEAALERSPGGEQPRPGLVVAVGVDRRAVLLLLDAVQVLQEQVVPLLKTKKRYDEGFFTFSLRRSQQVNG